jgi:hypothetical protein
MSTSEPSSHLTVRNPSPTLEVELLDSNFASIASTTGALDVSLEPGIYELRFREGSEHEERLLKVEAGRLVVDAPQFEPASPAPVEQTSTTHEYHQSAVVDASHRIGAECAAGGPETGGILVMVRNVAGQDDLPFPTDVDRRISVTDSTLAPIAGPNKQWQLEPGAGWAVWSAAVAPGGYSLRVDAPDQPEVLHQALWVEEGWQTMVFIPNTADGPMAELATIHIARVGQWTPWNEGSTAAIALESVLAGLRDGRPVVPSDLDELLHAKFVNPFLGLAGAHALLLEPRPSAQRLKIVIGNLQQLLPTSPDVAALVIRAGPDRVDVKAAPVSWPPMFYVGYRALIRADATNPNVLVDSSPAEDVAGRLRIAGLFTTWAEPRAGAASRSGGPAIGAIDAIAEPLDPATERVHAYIHSAARVQQTSPDVILRNRSVTQLALATGLPSASVRAAVKELEQHDA